MGARRRTAVRRSAGTAESLHIDAGSRPLLGTPGANTLRHVAGLRLARASVSALLAATALQVIVHAAYAIELLPSPDLDFSGEPCVDPPCGPEGLPPPELLPMVAPFLLLGLASLLGVALLVAALIRLAGTPRRAARSGVLLAVAPVLVLVSGELVPHAVSPCWFGEIPGVCERTEEHGVDWDGRIHLLAHGLVGWVPSTVLACWLLARWRPEVLPHAGSRSDA